MLMGVILIALIFYVVSPDETTKTYTYSEIEDLFKQEKVESFTLEGNELTLKLREEDPETKRMRSSRRSRAPRGSGTIWAS